LGGRQQADAGRPAKASAQTSVDCKGRFFKGFVLERRTFVTSIPDKLYFKIGEVSKIAELPTHVLRFWESEFGRIKPKRSPSGQRLYRRQDVELILKIKNLLYVKKYTIRGASKRLRIDDVSEAAETRADLLENIRRELESIRDLVS
jgi:DNA-binding transcriptional MerR regulator